MRLGFRYLKSWDYFAVVYDGDVYCVGCLPNGVEGHPIFAYEEWDYYPVCTVCGVEHDYIGLTEYGRREGVK